MSVDYQATKEQEEQDAEDEKQERSRIWMEHEAFRRKKIEVYEKYAENGYVHGATRSVSHKDAKTGKEISSTKHVYHLSSPLPKDIAEVDRLAWDRNSKWCTTGNWKTLCGYGRKYMSGFLWEKPGGMLCMKCEKIVTDTQSSAIADMKIRAMKERQVIEDAD